MEGIISTIISSIKNISIWSILDILVVSYIFYKAYKLIKETRAEQLIKGLVLVFLLIPISYILNLDMLYFILKM